MLSQVLYFSMFLIIFSFILKFLIFFSFLLTNFQLFFQVCFIQTLYAILMFFFIFYLLLCLIFFCFFMFLFLDRDNVPGFLCMEHCVFYLSFCKYFQCNMNCETMRSYMIQIFFLSHIIFSLMSYGKAKLIKNYS